MFAIEGVEKDAMTHVTNPEDKYITTIKEVVLAGLADEDVSIALFGSTVNKQKRQSSDVDIAIIPRNGWNQKKMALLREELENLNVPYKVDLVDFSFVSARFRKLALQTVVWWRK